jgi:RNA polymerase sigma factor (sigma-70 family)
MIKQYDSLDTYLNLAKKTISKFGSKFYSGLSKEMLQNNDAVSDVATAIMYADWRFDPDRKGKSGQQKTLYSYRNQCALWAIKTYVSKKYKNTKQSSNISLDFDYNEDSESLNSNIADNRAISPIDLLIEKESIANLKHDISALLDNQILSEKQKDQIRLYYIEDETLSSIGKKYGVSREAVRQNIKRGLDIIRQHDKY